MFPIPATDRWSMRAVACLLMVAAAPTPVVPADTVTRRGGAPPLQGEVLVIDDDGVRVKTPIGAEQVVPWDRVRGVQAARNLTNLGPRLLRAETLWRARSRVERGDTTLAEPLLEGLFEETRGRTGETALVVAEGLLRCRLARGEQAGAIVPALEVARLRRAGVSTISYANLPPVLDEVTQLCPALPPLVPAGPAVDRLRRELAAMAGAPTAEALPDRTLADPVIAAMAEAYAASLVLEPSGALGVPVAAPASREGESRAVRDHPGVILLRMALAASWGEATQRQSARQTLSNADLTSTWQIAWRHLFIGSSLLLDESSGSRRRGAIELLHLPARFQQSLPWLSGVALQLASTELLRQGEDADAALLRRELETLHPHHPLRWTAPSRPASPPPAPTGSPSRDSQTETHDAP